MRRCWFACIVSTTELALQLGRVPTTQEASGDRFCGQLNQQLRRHEPAPSGTVGSALYLKSGAAGSRGCQKRCLRLGRARVNDAGGLIELAGRPQKFGARTEDGSQ